LNIGANRPLFFLAIALLSHSTKREPEIYYKREDENDLENEGNTKVDEALHGCYVYSISWPLRGETVVIKYDILGWILRIQN
jgi:hypothetical protein